MAENYTLDMPCFNDTVNMTVYSKSFLCSKLEFDLSTCRSLQTVAETETIQTLCDAADIVWITGLWTSVITGAIGNGLSIITIASLPVSTSTFYIALLAISDLFAIFFQVTVHFLDKYRMYSRASNYWDVFPMLYDITASYSNWLLVLICLERYFTIRFPLHKRYYFTLKHARFSAIFLAAGIFTVYNCATWTLGYENMEMYKVRNLFYAGLPLLFILIIIGFISHKLRSIHKDRESLSGRVHSRGSFSVSEDQHTNASNIRRGSSTPLQEIARLENSITIMMFVAAICFSVLTIPNCIILYTYLHSAISWNTPVLRARWYLIQKISQVLTFMNLCVNFVLYFLSAKKFRTQLFKVLSRRLMQFGRRPSQNLHPFNNNSKTDNSHHLVYLDYTVYNNTSETSLRQPSEQMVMRKAKMGDKCLCSVPENSHGGVGSKNSMERVPVVNSKPNGVTVSKL